MTPRTATVAAITLALMLSLGASASAAGYVKIPDIKGEATDANHDKWIDVLSIDWGSHKPGGGATGQSRRSGSAQDVKIGLTIEYEKAAPKIHDNCVTGLLLPAVQLHWMPEREGRQGYLKYELKNVRITSYSVLGPGQGTRPKGVTLNYAAVKFVLSAETAEWEFVGGR